MINTTLRSYYIKYNTKILYYITNNITLFIVYRGYLVLVLPLIF